jgi:hypothetical protein
MIEMITQPPYKRNMGDGAKKCPYCGKQFNMTYDLYMQGYRLSRFGLNTNRCKQCGREFYFLNVTPKWVRETGIPAVYPKEFLKGVR